MAEQVLVAGLSNSLRTGIGIFYGGGGGGNKWTGSVGAGKVLEAAVQVVALYGQR